MPRILFILSIGLICASFAGAQPAAQWASNLGAGMNLSYLDNYWLGSKEKNFSDFAKPEDAAKRRKMFADIAKAGFKTVRIPICFSAWADLKAPYNWTNAQGLEMADNFVKWALENDLHVIIDLHHTEFDGSVPGAATTERIVSLWSRIAQRYKQTDHARVFFELRNEPHDIAAEDWRRQADEIIKTVRRIAPKHTLIVGFHDWNSRQSMIASKPFADNNIIYTFHYYDPFVFTHQGATWSAEGLADVKDVPFPWSKDKAIDVPASAKGKWAGDLIANYKEDSRAQKMFNDLKAAKDWSEKHKVPIFLGEFGSFSRRATEADRCRHAEVVFSALGKLKIPNAWWEWDGGFNMFKPGTTEISECMRKAIDSFAAAK